MSDLPRPSYRQPCMKLLEGSLAETKSNFKTETFRNRALPQPTALFSLSLAMRVFWSFSLGLLSLADILWKSSFFVSAGEPSGAGSNCQTLRQRREWRIRFSLKMLILLPMLFQANVQRCRKGQLHHCCEMLAISTRAETDDPSSSNTLRRTSSSTYLFCRRNTCRGETICYS